MGVTVFDTFVSGNINIGSKCEIEHYSEGGNTDLINKLKRTIRKAIK